MKEGGGGGGGSVWRSGGEKKGRDYPYHQGWASRNNHAVSAALLPERQCVTIILFGAEPFPPSNYAKPERRSRGYQKMRVLFYLSF